jgi:hypothetical protein
VLAFPADADPASQPAQAQQRARAVLAWRALALKWRWAIVTGVAAMGLSNS